MHIRYYENWATSLRRRVRERIVRAWIPVLKECPGGSMPPPSIEFPSIFFPKMPPISVAAGIWNER